MVFSQLVAQLNGGIHNSAMQSLRQAAKSGDVAELDRLARGSRSDTHADSYRARNNEALQVAAYGQVAVSYRARNTEALQVAAAYGQVAVLDWLLARGLTLEDCRAEENAALCSAAERGHVAVLDWLLARGITLDDCRAANNRALQRAAMYGRVKVLDWLLARGITLEDCRANKYIALQLASSQGHVAVLNWFIVQGATFAMFKEAHMSGFWHRFYRAGELALIVGQRSCKPWLPTELWELIDEWYE